MDAVAAACLASCVLDPALCDLGGYVCCAVVLEGDSGRVWSVDANSVAPAAAHENMFTLAPVAGANINTLEYGLNVRDDANLYGPLSVAVPGLMAGIGTLWERWGRLKWEQIVAPAQRLVDEGFPYGASTVRAISIKDQVIRRFPETAAHLMPSGTAPSEDDVWRRPGLEKALARLARAGWRDFYDGEIGRDIADFITSGGGVLTREDMAAYQPRVTEPYAATYRDGTVFSSILPNGGISVLQILNMLECFEVAPDSEPSYWHRFAEVLKLAWRERLSCLGDPDFADIPVARFLSKQDAAERTNTLRRFPDLVDRQRCASHEPSGGTAQISAADAEGNLVAATISHGGLFGSCLTVPGWGFTLGHGMCRFDPRPGRPNSVAPRKRPLNNVAPTIVRLSGRDIATGLRGGRKIISVCAQLCQRFADFGLMPLEAATAPRIHAEGQEPIEVSESLDPRTFAALAELGHDLRRVPQVGDSAHSAEWIPSQKRIRAGGNVCAAGV